VARKAETKGLPLMPLASYAELVEEARRRPLPEYTKVAFIPGDLGWALRIMKRVEAGEKVPVRAIECAREALAWQAERQREPGEDDEDPTPWCQHCGAMTRERCGCGPIAEND
jgi:hypothetical protein